MVLTGGRTFYTGAQEDAIPYFWSLGHPLPVNTNPADHLLHITNSEFTDLIKVRGIINAWDEQSIISVNPSIGDPQMMKPHVNIATQLVVLLRRHSTLSLLDPVLYTGRIVAFLLTGLMLSVVYFYTRHHTLNMAVKRVIMEGWFFAVPSLLTSMYVYQTSIEMKNILQEVRLGYVNIFPYVMAKLLIEIPFMFVLSFETLGPGFAIISFNAKAFGPIVLRFQHCYWLLKHLPRLQLWHFTTQLTPC